MKRRPRPALWFALVALGTSGASACRRAEVRPPLVLISLDTTRADRLGCYGAARPTSPHLDRLARDALVYTRAVSTSSWTLPAHATLFTGKLTSAHGAHYDPEGPLDLRGAIDGPEEWRHYRVRPLALSERTLAEILRDAGYRTAGVVAGPWLKQAFGLAQGFEAWDDSGITTANGRLAGSVTDAALLALDAAGERPLFLFLHYFDPHGPYLAPEPYGHAFLAPGAPLAESPQGEELVARYDAEILYMDHELGRFLDGLRARGRYDRALVVVTSDHGELLGEHGRVGHGHHLTEPELRIPLIVKFPKGRVAPARDATRVQLTDVLPIVLNHLGLPLPAGIQGGLPPRAGIRGKLPPSVGHPIVAEVYPPEALSPEGDWRALYDGRHKLLWSSQGRHALYDLERDPGELANLAGREAARVQRLGTLLSRFLDALPRPGEAGPPRTLDAETAEALRALGYVR